MTIRWGYEMAKAKQAARHGTKGSALDRVDLGQIPSEEISLEEAEELTKLSAETKKEGLSWDKVKAELGL